MDVLDGLYAEPRRCRRLCGGRKGQVDHARPVGLQLEGKKIPGHRCDKRCSAHVCRPLEPATILHIHSILRRAFKYAVKWRWIRENPAQLATVPPAMAQVTDPPSPAEATMLQVDLGRLRPV